MCKHSCSMKSNYQIHPVYVVEIQVACQKQLHVTCNLDVFSFLQQSWVKMSLKAGKKLPYPYSMMDLLLHVKHTVCSFRPWCILHVKGSSSAMTQCKDSSAKT